MLIGKDILRRHNKVILNFRGTENDLIVGALHTPNSSTSVNLKTLEPMKVPHPPLFTNLAPNIQLIAINSSMNVRTP